MSSAPLDYYAPDARGQVRLLIADTDPDNQVLSDDMIAGYLVIESGSVKRAAALALEAIASSETLVSKVIKTQDLSTNGPAVAADLRTHATSLREQAEKDEDDSLAWDVIDFVPQPYTAAEATEIAGPGFW